MGGCETIDGRPAGAGLPSPCNKTWSYEEWMGRRVTSVSTQQGYLSNTANGGAIAEPGTLADASHWGTIDLSITNAINSRAHKRQEVAQMFMGTGVFFWETCLRTDTVPAGVDDFLLEAGVSNNITSEAADGIYFFGDLNSANWRCKTANGGGRTNLDSGVAMAIDTWFRFGFIMDALGTTVSFFIDGVFVATTGLTLPVAGVVSGIKMFRSAASGGNVIYTNDYVWWEKDFIPPR